MRLIILNQFFHPDHSATSQLMTDLAESLVERGITVTALAGRGRYGGGTKLPARESYRGVQIERAWATGFGKGRLAGRIADYLSFYLGACWKLLRLPRHDVIMPLTTPPLIGLAALVIGRLRRMRVVMLVQDVYPDIAVALGALPANGPLTGLLEWFNRQTLNRADVIVVLSECMRDRIAAKLSREAASRITVIHNWADGLAIKPLGALENPFAVEHKLDGKFVVLFSGNLGLVNEFSTVLKAARLLRQRSDIVFFFVGDGASLSEMRGYCETQGLDNVRFLPYQPRELLRYSLSAAHACLVTLKDGLAGLSVPSKTYGIMAAGRPILFVGDQRCTIARIVEENGCGAVVKADDAQELADIVSRWSSDPMRLEKLGAAARTLFERRFDRRHAVEAYINIFSKSSNSIMMDTVQQCDTSSRIG
jgi:glycosyltransferase involved in cell wall biosynthesis